MDAVRVVDKYAAGFHFGAELIEALLVEGYHHVVFVEYRRRDFLVAEYDGYVGGAAALFRAVAGHPRYLFVVHKARVGQYLAHRQYTLSAETGYDDFFFHC